VRIALGGPRGAQYDVDPLEPALDYGQIIQGQLALEGLDVPIWINRAQRVRNVLALERSHYLHKRVALRGCFPGIRGGRSARPDDRKQVVQRDLVLCDLTRAGQRGQLSEALVR